MLVCLVPPELQDRIYEPLARHYGPDPRVRVVVDRRAAQRRASETPAELPYPPPRGERRRGSDRRRPVLPRMLRPLPDELAHHAEKLRFVQRLLPVGTELGGASLSEILERVQSGDPEAPTELYWRSFERVHSELRKRISVPAAVNAAVAPAFGAVLDAVETAGPQAAERFEELLVDAVAGVVPPIPETDEDALADVDAGRSLAITDPALDEPVVVVERDPDWFGRGRAERKALLDDGGDDVVAVEHIGGTAVPAVPARPIVDLLVGVRRLPVRQPLLDLLAERGYVECGEGGTPGRAYFRKRGSTSYDVHVVEHLSDLWTEPIALREHLREHHLAAQRLAAAKLRAAQRFPWSARRYARARATALARALAGMRTPTRAA